MTSSGHAPVLLDEALAALAPIDHGVYVDATFGGGGYARAILGAANCAIFAFDRDPTAIERARDWAGAYGGRVNDSTYLWQPIHFPSDTQMTMSWENVLDLDAQAGKVAGSVESFVIINKKSGLYLDVEGSDTQDSGDIVQNAPSAASSQRWWLDYNGRGHFRLKNDNSKRVIDVPDESSADGIELVQWEDHNGENQGWRLIDLGRGEYQIQNELSDKYMGVVMGSVQEGAAVEQRAATGGDEQVWELVVAE